MSCMQHITQEQRKREALELNEKQKHLEWKSAKDNG